MCQQRKQMSGAFAASMGSQLEYSTEADKRPVDLDYWSDLAYSYQPEWFPLGQTTSGES